MGYHQSATKSTKLLNSVTKYVKNCEKCERISIITNVGNNYQKVV